VWPTPSHLTPPLPPARACSTPNSADSAATIDSPDCSHASVFSVLLGSPSHTPRLLSHPLSCFSPKVPNLFDASDLVSDVEVPIPCLHVSPTRRPSAHAAAASLANSDDKVHNLRIPPRPALVPCDGDDEGLILRRASLSLLLFPSNWSPSPCRAALWPRTPTILGTSILPRSQTMSTAD
jgi:hypothetical protein